MARKPDVAKLREWSERFQRFAKSSQTVADFCRAEGVVQPSFYYWKRRLTGSSQRRQSVKGGGRSAPAAHPSASFRSVVITPPADGASVKIQLPGGVVIEMRDDLVVIEHVVKQLLDHRRDTGGKGC